MKKSQKIIQILLGLLIIFLAFQVYKSIMSPVKFNKEMRYRQSKIIQRMKDFRDIEFLYKSKNRKYIADFDTLLSFIKNDSIPVIKMVPDPNDTTFTKTIRDTIGKINVYDSIFGKRENFNVDLIFYIPFSERYYKNGLKFDIKAGTIERSKISIPVFEIKAHDSTYLSDLDKQLMLNNIETKKQMDKYPGVKVGSMTEASTDGNWE